MVLSKIIVIHDLIVSVIFYIDVISYVHDIV